MGITKISFEDSLGKSVLATGKCVGCGTCVVVCPFDCLEYVNWEPHIIRECKVCGICAQTCPVYQWSWSKAEKFVFGKERKTEEEFGVYSRLAVVRAKDNEILKVCQDGGAVTALISFALKEGIIDGAIVSGISLEKPFYPVPRLAATQKEILECAGTRYSYSPNILALTEVAEQKKANIAFVGTPCQIHAIRKIQMSNLKKYSAPLKFLIGLMCSECFTYDGLMDKHIHETLGIKLDAVKKVNIKGKMLVKTETEVKTIPLADVKQYVRKSCKFCDDFSSELADISAGGLGLDGWTFTIIRTEKGEEIFSKAEKSGIIETRNVDAEESALNLLRKLSKKKRQNKGFDQ
jgi:coenzyme F420 hydrogenase subunit beta